MTHKKCKTIRRFFLAQKLTTLLMVWKIIYILSRTNHRESTLTSNDIIAGNGCHFKDETFVNNHHNDNFSRYSVCMQNNKYMLTLESRCLTGYTVWVTIVMVVCLAILFKKMNIIKMQNLVATLIRKKALFKFTGKIRQ